MELRFSRSLLGLESTARLKARMYFIGFRTIKLVSGKRKDSPMKSPCNKELPGNLKIITLTSTPTVIIILVVISLSNLLPSFPVLSWLARLEFLFILCVLC
jgi:hypothetical protein